MRAPLLVLLAAATLVGQPRIYRWRDRSGKEHITNTPPPPGATALDVPPATAPPAPAAVAGEAPRPSRPAAATGLPPAQEEQWRSLDQRLEEARTKQDTAAIEGIVEGLFRDSLWGHGLWAIPLLPVATLALVVLLGWWAGSGLRQPWPAAFLVLSVLLGTGLGHLTLTRFLTRIQLARLQASLGLLELHLGGRLPRPSHRAALQQHRAALEAAARPLAPPWAFLLEARAAEDTMVKVALDP